MDSEQVVQRVVERQELEHAARHAAYPGQQRAEQLAAHAAGVTSRRCQPHQAARQITDVARQSVSISGGEKLRHKVAKLGEVRHSLHNINDRTWVHEAQRRDYM